MNEILKAIESRRSVRKFKPDLPAKESIDAVVQAGLQAASGKNEQAAMALVVTDKALRGAPAILIVLGRKDFPTYLYDGSLMLGNMMLAAHSLGLANIWIHRAKEEFETEKYQNLLKQHGIEGEWEGIGHLALGFAAGDLPQAHAIKEGRVFYLS